jgi:hypothetical protein
MTGHFNFNNSHRDTPSMRHLFKAAKLPKVRYSLRLHTEQLEHLKANSKGLPPSAYLRSLVDADMLQWGEYAKAI